MKNKRLYGKICAVQRELSRQNNALLAGNGITPIQLHVLISLHKSEQEGKQLCQRDIERELSIRPSSVSSLLSVLESKGYIVRSYAADNARTKIVTLTESGRQLCINNKLLMEDYDLCVQSVLSEEEQDELARLLDKILRYVNENKN